MDILLHSQNLNLESEYVAASYDFDHEFKLVGIQKKVFGQGQQTKCYHTNSN